MIEDVKVKNTRPRGRPIKVWVYEAERDAIVARAAQAGLSHSAFLRAAGLNQPIRSVFDLDAVSDLAKVNGDLGRVAGLLKLWLADHRGFGAKPAEVEQMMKEFRMLQAEILRLMGAALRRC
ncbi:conjugal transfer protein TraJ [uncultured Sphingomonas sp.]|uniref:plasmid mobilization protein n=1 Tax=uncultured Sphingomonas sp. TaxID=158754 RepID=UPI0025DFCF77|nr:conjugal transfer protein TraJ [uncultured Sphingomonas sp.]